MAQFMDGLEFRNKISDCVKRAITFLDTNTNLVALEIHIEITDPEFQVLLARQNVLKRELLSLENQLKTISDKLKPENDEENAPSHIRLEFEAIPSLKFAILKKILQIETFDGFSTKHFIEVRGDDHRSVKNSLTYYSMMYLLQINRSRDPIAIAFLNENQRWKI